ncbi:MAG: BatA domain-containing protein [Gemmataceae bacterium]|nr:BatA domain-containing protein [Gemmata sp.]MDW8197399.1 BatA domain-containing protein [Gemmataceae bacterium]
MMSLFLNPWTFVAGALLVSTPIIIHLINRIRFRRIRWAAMEFLLKAQKRMRRRKILEQLLLLLLRCLLVFLAGVLLARYIGCGTGEGQETRPTTHVVILDDSPSMADAGRREDGGEVEAFAEAKRLVYEKLMPAMNEATTPQTLFLVRLSDVDRPYPEPTKQIDGKTVPKSPDELRDEARVSGEHILAMQSYLSQFAKPADVRRSLVEGLAKAQKILDAAPANDARVVHIISDLRAVDWTVDGPAIQEFIRKFKENGITVNIVDVVHPVRKVDTKSPRFNDNLAIVELRPRNRVVSVNQQTEIEVRVKNFGNTDMPNVRIDFYRNEEPDVIPTIQIPNLPANQERTEITTATFHRTGTKEKPWERFNVVTAVLASGEPGGLKIDNVRRTVVEVRNTLKVLMVDGRTMEGGVDIRNRPEADSAYLRAMLLNPKLEMKRHIGDIEVINGEYGQLEKIDLRPFTTVYLVNVPTLSEAAVANLEKFIRNGGGVGVFLGPNVKPEDYNLRMYRGSAGFFPFPLPANYSNELTPQQKELRAFSFTPRLMVRDPAMREHPALKGVYSDENGRPVKPEVIERYFRFPIIEHHWEVSRRGIWRDDKSVQELYCLPNEAPIAEFESRVEALVSEIRKRYNEPKFERARQVLDGPRNSRRSQLEELRLLPKEANPLSELARLLDELLCDQTNTGDESEPILREFWSQPEMAEVRQQAMLLRDEAKYGDPLYVVKQFGRGRVAVMTTDAGGTYPGKKIWNDWPSLSGAAGWVVVAAEMQKYLSGGGEDLNRAVGHEFFAEFDAQRYEPKVEALLLLSSPVEEAGKREVRILEKKLEEITMDSPPQPPETPADAPPRPFQLKFANTREMGTYIFMLKRKKDEVRPGTPLTPDPLGDLDFVGVSYNVEALIEGDLRRESTEELEKHTDKVPIYNTDDLTWIDKLKQKPSDMSSRRWIYLLILLVLMAEQAWAVRMSYHSKPDDLETLAPSAAAAFAHTTVPVPSANGETAESPTVARSA